MSDDTKFHVLQLMARDVEDIEKWIVNNSTSAIKQKTKHEWLKRFFKPITICDAQLVNVNYHLYEPSMNAESDNELWNVQGYSCKLIYHLSQSGQPAMTLDHLPDIYCKKRRQTHARIGAMYEQELFLPARNWPFITAHLVFDWLFDPSFEEARHSDRYSVNYNGLNSFLALYITPVDGKRIGPAIQRMYEEVFTKLPWQSLLDLHAAGVLPANKRAFAEWLCPYVTPEPSPHTIPFDIPNDIVME